MMAEAIKYKNENPDEKGKIPIIKETPPQKGGENKQEEQKNNKKTLNEQKKKQMKIEETEADKDKKAIIKQLTDPWPEKHIKAETEAEHKKRVEEAKKEIKKIMEEAKKRDNPTALHDLLIDKAKDPSTPSWFLALLAQLRLSYYYADLDMFKALAGNPNTPPELLAALATRKRYFWRRGYIPNIGETAAENQSTPPETLAKLLLRGEPLVKYAAAANPSTPPYALSKFILSKLKDDDHIMEAIVKSRDKSDLTLGIAINIIKNPSTPKEVLEYALKREYIGLFVLDNPSISKYPDLLELASKNEDPFISKRALEMLKKLKELDGKVINELSAKKRQ
jgi:hypothetical protein